MNTDFNLKQEEEVVNAACRHQSKMNSKSEEEEKKKEMKIFLSMSVTSSWTSVIIIDRNRGQNTLWSYN